MKYMLLAYTNAGGWDDVDVTSAEFQAMCDFYEGLEAELTESGEFVESVGLSDPSHTKVVRKQSGGVVATDGPFAEAKEALVATASWTATATTESSRSPPGWWRSSGTPWRCGR